MTDLLPVMKVLESSRTASTRVKSLVGLLHVCEQINEGRIGSHRNFSTKVCGQWSLVVVLESECLHLTSLRITDSTVDDCKLLSVVLTRKAKVKPHPFERQKPFWGKE